MAENQNTPLGGNTSNNGISADALIAAIDHLASSSNETIKVLKSIANQVKGGKGSSNFDGEQLTKSIKKYIKEENDNRVRQIKELGNVTKSLKANKDFINRYNKEIEEECRKLSKYGLSKETKELDSYLKNLNASMDSYIKSSSGYLHKYKDSIRKDAHHLDELEHSIARLNVDYSKATEKTKESIKAALNAKLKEKEEIEQRYETNKKIFEKEQKYNEYRRDLERQNAEELKDLLGKRVEIESRNADLLSNSRKNLKESFSKYVDFFNPKSSEAYLSQKAEVESYDKEATEAIKAIDSEFRENEILISKETKVVEESLRALQKINGKLAVAKANDDKVKKEELEQKKKVREEQLKQSKRNLEEAKGRNENLKQQKTVLKGNQDANKKFLENLNKQTTVWQNIGNKVGDTISKAITTVLDRELTRLINAADSAFTAIENTEKSLGKTLKMSTGAYQDYVDLVQSYAKEAGLAIDQNQVLELSATLSEMGLRDENLIATLATEQAKIQEAGLNGILQLNEETIKQYQKQYLQDKQQYGDETASANLEERLDNLIAIESYVSENLGSATALANGGMTEILNRVTSMKSMGYISGENEDYFTANLAYMAQVFDNAGADFSTILTDFDTLLNTTESNLTSQQKAVLNQMGTTTEIMEQYAKDPTAVISKYIGIVQSQYNNMDLSSMKYVQEALGDSYTAVQRMTEQNSGVTSNSLKSQAVSLNDIQTTADKINKNLKDGTYLTETEKLEKKELETMQEIAQYAQKIPDGQFWMDNTFNAGKSLLNELGGLLGNAIGSFIGSSVGRIGWGNKQTTTLTTGAEGTPTGTSMGSFGQFMTGKSGTKAGMAGKYVSGFGGLAVSGASLGYSLYKGEDITDALQEDAFTTGLGMAIGGAIGGPIGAAVGGVITKTVVGPASKALEDYVVNKVADPAGEAYELMKEAGQELHTAANDLSDSATQQLIAIKKEQEEAKNYSSQQKKSWLLEHEKDFQSMGIKVDDLLKDLTSDTAISKAYETLSSQYYEKAEDTANKLMSSADVAKSIADVYGKSSLLTSTEGFQSTKGRTEADLVKQLRIGSISQEMYDEEMAEIAEKRGLGLLTKMGDTEGLVESFSNLISAKAESEDSYIIKRLQKTGASESQIEAAKIQLALTKYASETGQNIDDITNMYSVLEKRKKGYAIKNEEFQKLYKQAKDKAGSDNVTDILNAFLSLKSTFTEDDFLNATTKDGSILQTLNSYSDVPSLNTYGNYAGYKTGLDFVPYDNYLALLHQGETVLNSTEANEYRAGNSINISDITSTMITQTDRIESMLTKIYTAILSIGRSSNSRSTLSSNIVNMVSGIATM